MGHEADANAARREADRLRAIQDLAAGGPRLLDRFGRPILIGCEVEFHSSLPNVFTVVDAKPNFNANAPAGQWILTLTTEFAIMGMNGQRHQILTVVAMPEAPPAEVVESGQPGEPAAERPPHPDDPAASDAPAGPPSSIILTDMDKTARETLEALATGKAKLVLVSQAKAIEPPAYDSLKELENTPTVGDLQSPAAKTLRETL